MSIFGRLFLSSKKRAYQKYKHDARRVKNKHSWYKHGTSRTLRKFRRGKI